MPGSRSIVLLLTALSLMSYLLRTNISVAAKLMMPELGLDEAGMGRVFSAFLVGYTVFQVPWGVAGDRWGVRLPLTLSALLCGAATLATGLVPAAGALALLLAVRFLLGFGEAAMYPLAARAVSLWVPMPDRAFAYSLVIAGSTVGAAAAGPLVAWVMVRAGWRESFYLTSAVAFLLAGLWYAAARSSSAARSPRQALGGFFLLRNRNFGLVCTSYFLDSYVLYVFVFWLYLYLVEERKFGLLNSGLYSALPWIAATLAAPLAGRLSDRLAARSSLASGRRAVPIACLIGAAALLFAGVTAAGAFAALAAISVSTALLTATEGPYWSATIDLAGADAGAAGGVLNLAGNLGGLASTVLVPVLVQRFGWPAAIGSASLMALGAAALWFGVRVAGPAEETTL
jgi:ACS family glucarate transporter-like MFS transporter